MAICFRSKNIDPQIHSNGPSKYKHTRHKQPLTFLFPVYIDPGNKRVSSHYGNGEFNNSVSGEAAVPLHALSVVLNVFGLQRKFGVRVAREVVVSP